MQRWKMNYKIFFMRIHVITSNWHFVFEKKYRRRCVRSIDCIYGERLLNHNKLQNSVRWSVQLSWVPLRWCLHSCGMSNVFTAVYWNDGPRGIDTGRRGVTCMGTFLWAALIQSRFSLHLRQPELNRGWTAFCLYLKSFQ